MTAAYRAAGVETEIVLAGFATFTAASLLLLSAWMGFGPGPLPHDPTSVVGTGLFGPNRTGVHAPPGWPGSEPASPTGASGTGGESTRNQSGGGNSTGTGNGTSGGNGTQNSSGARHVPGVRLNASVLGGLGVYAQTFFGSVIQTPNITDPWLQEDLSGTPIVSYSFGDGIEGNDQIHSIAYADNGSTSADYVTNDIAFVAFCQAIHCRALMGVPGEIDDPTEAAAIVRYVEVNLSFHPYYWGIGNEPQGWLHYGIPWSHWQVSDNSTPTPTEYAQLVQRYVIAMRAADPTIKIIGIESADGGSGIDSPWLDAVASLNSANLSALAIHPYPGGRGTPTSTVSDFFSTLTNFTKFPNNYPVLTTHLWAACGCHLPLLVGEYNAGVTGNLSPYIESYPEVPYLAAGIAGALKVGVPEVNIFSLMRPSIGMISSNGTMLPSFVLYNTFLKNLSVGSIWNTTMAGAPGGVFSVATSNGTHWSLLIANTNLTSAINVTLPMQWLHANGFPSQNYTTWSWGPLASAPTVFRGSGGVPSYWGVPAEGVFLIDLTA